MRAAYARTTLEREPLGGRGAARSRARAQARAHAGGVGSIGGVQRRLLLDRAWPPRCAVAARARGVAGAGGGIGIGIGGIVSGELWTTLGTELRIARVAARRRLGTLPPLASTLRHAVAQLARANDALERRLAVATLEPPRRKRR